MISFWIIGRVYLGGFGNGTGGRISLAVHEKLKRANPIIKVDRNFFAWIFCAPLFYY